jgi:hypothetical protein
MIIRQRDSVFPAESTMVHSVSASGPLSLLPVAVVDEDDEDDELAPGGALRPVVRHPECGGCLPRTGGGLLRTVRMTPRGLVTWPGSFVCSGVGGGALLEQSVQDGLWAGALTDATLWRQGASMRVFSVSLLALVLLAAPAQAQVQVDIGFSFPAPPPLVVVPEVQTVQYVPDAPGNVFFYGSQYWVFRNGGWVAGRAHNGPWIVVAPQYVPRPILLVPVHYYRVPPGQWKKWHGNEAPRWSSKWGREWSEEHERKAEEHERKKEQASREHEQGKEHGNGNPHGHGGGH